MTLVMAVTGGIGAGKSTVSARLADLGALVVDSDRLARDVVAPGTPGLAEIEEAFGPSVITAGGELDRAALAAIVFADPQARERLEAITHPRVRAGFAAAVATAPADAIVVNDIPLLLRPEVAAGFHLVLGVHADPEVRVRRLIERGLPEADARRRMAAQIDDAQRAPLCDVWLSNHGEPDELTGLVDRLWWDRILPFRDNLAAGTVPGTGEAPDADGVRRAVHRVAGALDIDPDLVAADVPELTVPAGSGQGSEQRLALRRAGFPALDALRHGAADPGVRLVVRLPD